MPKVRFTSNLQRFYPDLKPEQIEGNSIADLLNKVDSIYPGIRDYIVDEQGHLRKHVNVFIGNQLIKDKKELSDPVSSDDEVWFMQALSGG